MPDLSLLAPIASALADHERLHAYATAVLAGAEGTPPAELGRHAARLQGTGLLRERPEDGRLVADAEPFAAALRGPAKRREAPGAPGADVAQLFRDGRLTEIPVRPARRLALLAHLTERVFEPGVRYTEPEVNIALKQYWDDCAALRRYLVENGFLTRSADGTSYRVTDAVAADTDTAGRDI